MRGGFQAEKKRRRGTKGRNGVKSRRKQREVTKNGSNSGSTTTTTVITTTTFPTQFRVPEIFPPQPPAPQPSNY